MRDADATLLAGATAPVVRPVILAALDWPSGMVRLASPPFDIVMDGQTYRGVGDLGSIGVVEEGTETRSYGLTLSITGIRPEYLTEVTTNPIQGRPVLLHFGLVDESHSLIGTPLQIWGGRMDVATIELGQTATITVTAESRLVDWERPRVRRYTHEDQQASFPADMGLEFVSSMSEIELVWGR